MGALHIAILYTSIGYGLGPIIGPFIGGVLQHYIGWQASFVALTIVGSLLLLALFLLVKESIPKRQPLHIKAVGARLGKILKNKTFMVGAVINGIIQVQIMLYPSLYPFVVENTLHKSALIYGNTALLVGAGYLTGNLINRYLLSLIPPKLVCYVGFIVLLLAVTIAYTFTVFFTLNLWTLIIPIILICISSGLIFANIMGNNLKQFPESAGAAMSIQSTATLLTGSTGILIASHLHIANLFQFATLFLVLAAAQAILFFSSYQTLFDRR